MTFDKIRHAFTLDVQANSDANIIELNPLDDMVRPEFGHESDINVLIKRGLSAARPSLYGEQDLTLTPSDRHLAAHEARAAFQRLPKAITDRFTGWVDLLRADPKALEELLAVPSPTSEAPPAPAGQAPTAA